MGRAARARTLGLLAGAGLLAAALPLAGRLAVRAGAPPRQWAAAPGVAPSAAPADPIALSNGRDLQALWLGHSAVVGGNPGFGGPGLGALHAAPAWGANLVAGQAFSLIDRTTGARLDRGAAFAVGARLGASGVLQVTYGGYAGRLLPVALAAATVLPPGEPFLVTRYRLGVGARSAPARLLLLDQVRLGSASGARARAARYDPALDSLLVPTRHGVVFLAALSRPVGHEAAAGTRAGDPWRRFDVGQPLAGGAVGHGVVVDLALAVAVSAAPARAASVSFVLGVAPDAAAARADVRRAEGLGGDALFAATARFYARWLAAGRGTGAPGALGRTYERALVRLVNAENPATGLFALGARTQVGTSALAGMALLAAGHGAPTRPLWRTLGRAEGRGGRWPSALDPWTGAPLAAAGPTYGDLGLVLAGMLAAGRGAPDAAAVWRPLWPAASRIAGFLAANVGADGLGPPDRGPWHGAFAYWAYSQGMYALGLNAAGEIAQALGRGGDEARYADAAATLTTTLETPQSASLPGLWNDSANFYDQAQSAGGGPEMTVDASLTPLWAFGVLPIGTARAQQSLFAIDTALDRGRALAPFPGAPAALGPAVVDQLMRAVDELDLGQRAAALRDLGAYSGGGGAGGAAAFVLADLAYRGQERLRVAGPLAEAGAYLAPPAPGGASTAAWAWQDLPYDDLAVASALRAGRPAAPAARIVLANVGADLLWHVAFTAPGRAGAAAAATARLVLYAQPPGVPGEGSDKGLFGGALVAAMSDAVLLGPGPAGAILYRAAGAGRWRRVGALAASASLDGRAGGAWQGRLAVAALLGGGARPPATDGRFTLELGRVEGQGGARREVDLAPVRYRWTGPGETPLAGVPPGALIDRLSTDRARYDPGQPVRVTAEVANQGPHPLEAVLSLAVSHLGQPVPGAPAVRVDLEPGGAGVYHLVWRAPRANDEGYLVHAQVRVAGGRVLDSAVTAVDVSSSWTAFPRYGYLTAFGVGAAEQAAWTVSVLNLYHLDALQFYDWQYQHGRPLAGTPSHPAPVWPNVAGVTTLRRSVLALIDQAHHSGMLAFEYDLLYGAWAQTVGRAGGPARAWALYAQPGCADALSYPLPAGWQTPAIDLFDPASAAWQAYIDGRERAVFAAYPFDGWQVDQLGAQGPTYACDGRPVDLAAAFRPFLLAAKARLGRRLVFNAVGDYGQTQAARPPSPLDVTYTEAWPSSGQITYGDLGATIAGDRALSGGRLAQVIAAYPDSTLARTYSDGAPGNFGAAGVRLLDAAIFASGGDHIELGDQAQMLSGPYFPSEALQMGGTLAQAMVNEYNFITAYENALRGPGLSDLAAAVTLAGVPVSESGQAGTVWAFARRRAGLDVLELINLRGRTSGAWSDPGGTDPPPPVLHGARVRVSLPGVGGVRAVRLASPDLAGGVARRLPFRVTRSRGGIELSFRLPVLDYWDTVMVARR